MKTVGSQRSVGGWRSAVSRRLHTGALEIAQELTGAVGGLGSAVGHCQPEHREE